MRDFFKRLICQIMGHKELGGYWLEYVKPTMKEPIGFYHDLVLCGRCGLPFRIDSEIFTLKEYREWEKQ